MGKSRHTKENGGHPGLREKSREAACNGTEFQFEVKVESSGNRCGDGLEPLRCTQEWLKR